MSNAARRGTTSILNYALLLVIVTLLIAGLFVGVNGLVTGQQEQAIGSQFVTVGNRLAADVSTADRLVRTANTSADTQVRFRSDLPETVGGSQYRIAIASISGARYELTIQSTNPEVQRTVIVRSTVGIQEDTVAGGPVIIEYNGAQLVVRRA